MRISDLAIGDTAKIVGFAKQSLNYRNKLLSMGLIPGTVFALKRVAPLGDPIEIIVRDFSLILRKKEAHIILIERV